MAEDALFRRIATAIIVALFASSLYYRDRADRKGGRVARDDEPSWLRVGLTISGVMGFGGLVLFLAWPPALGWTLVPVPLTMRWLGAFVAASSVASTWWIFHTLGLNITRTSKTRDGATLVTTGPYRFVRHPFYANLAIALSALSLATRSWWVVAWVVPAVILLGIRTRREEANLEARFGDAWRAYAARTGRFVPRLSMK